MEKILERPIKPGNLPPHPRTVRESAPCWAPNLMPKTQPPCTSAESNLGDRVLGEVEENSFIALAGKGGHSRLLHQNTISQLGRNW